MHEPNRVDPYEESLPPGYRLRGPDEMTVAGDIYWSTKWYRVPEHVALVGHLAREYEKVATKIDPTHRDNVRSVDDEFLYYLRQHDRLFRP